jgi:hypothetical protein
MAGVRYGFVVTKKCYHCNDEGSYFAEDVVKGYAEFSMCVVNAARSAH